MAFQGNFKRSNQPVPANRPALPAQQVPSAAQQGSRYAGVEGVAPREPIMSLGTYRVRVLETSESMHPQKRSWTYKAKLRIEAAAEGSAHSVGEEVVVLNPVEGSKAATYGQQRVVDFVQHAAGFAGRAERAAFDPNNHLVDATAGRSTPMSHFTIEGRLLDVRSTRGHDIIGEDGQPTGEFYCNYYWQVVPEEEQDATPCIEAQAQAAQ